MSGVQLPHIAFIGRAGAGKTTCAQALVERFGYERLSFAAPLKAGCATTDDRGLLQRVGQGVRDLHEDFWVNLFLADVAARTDEHYADSSYHRAKGGPKFVVDDCRYPNEAAALKAAGFVIVRVDASPTTRLDRLRLNGRLQDEAQLQHESETALDRFEPDYYVWNGDQLDTDDLVDELTVIINRVRS